MTVLVIESDHHLVAIVENRAALKKWCFREMSYLGKCCTGCTIKGKEIIFQCKYGDMQYDVKEEEVFTK